MNSTVYLDHNATAPLRPEAHDLLRRLLDEPAANPGSAHARGRQARARVELARGQVARLLGVPPAWVTFTASGTEACNLALLGAAGLMPAGRRHILTTTIEHAAVLAPLARLAASGWMGEAVPVGASGRLDAAELLGRLRPDTALVAVMAANNETGIRQPVDVIGRACRERGVLFCVDGTQVAGRLPQNLMDAPCDLFALSAHKLGGPQGAGALIVRPGTALAPQLLGGGQEAGLRGGTENVAALAAFGAAAEAAGAGLEAESARLDALRRRLNSGVLARVPGATLVGDAAHALPNTSMFSVPHEDEEILILALDRRGFAVSAGAACTAGAHERSHVVRAMGLESSGRAVVRVSLGAGNTVGDVDGFVAALAACVAPVPVDPAEVVR
jgi:cysteine desulfurase